MAPALGNYRLISQFHGNICLCLFTWLFISTSLVDILKSNTSPTKWSFLSIIHCVTQNSWRRHCVCPLMALWWEENIPNRQWFFMNSSHLTKAKHLFTNSLTTRAVWSWSHSPSRVLSASQTHATVAKTSLFETLAHKQSRVCLAVSAWYWSLYLQYNTQKNANTWYHRDKSTWRAYELKSSFKDKYIKAITWWQQVELFFKKTFKGNSMTSMQTWAH